MKANFLPLMETDTLAFSLFFCRYHFPFQTTMDKLSSELFLSRHVIIAPHPNLLQFASGDALLDYDQGIRHLAAMPKECRQVFLEKSCSSLKPFATKLHKPC
jgi:hypothetical protein